MSLFFARPVLYRQTFRLQSDLPVAWPVYNSILVYSVSKMCALFSCSPSTIKSPDSEDCVLVASLSGRQQLVVCRHMQVVRSDQRPRRTTSHGLLLFMDPTHGTAFQLNCDWLILRPLFAVNWKLIYSAFDCCRAHLRFWINLRVINVRIIIIIIIIKPSILKTVNVLLCVVADDVFAAPVEHGSGHH